MGRYITIDHAKIDEYVALKHEEEAICEIAKKLKVSSPVISESIKRLGLKGRTRGNNAYFGSVVDKDSIEYWPTFEEMDSRWHDALINIMAEAMEGEAKERKEQMQNSRPPAVYDIIVKSHIVKEYLNAQGFRVKS